MVVPATAALILVGFTTKLDEKENTTMAEGQSMMVADVVERTMDGRLEHFEREAVRLLGRELMNAEISADIGAELATSDSRAGDGRLQPCAGIA